MADTPIPVGAGSLTLAGQTPTRVATTNNRNLSFDETLPQFVVFAAMDQGLALPQFAVNATVLNGSITNVFQDPLPLPQFTVTTSILTGEVVTASAQLPQFSVDASSGDSVEVVLPALTASATVLVGEAVTGDIDLPALELSATGFPETNSDLTLPQFVVAATVLQGVLVEGEATLSALSLAATMATGGLVTANLTLPSMSMSAVGYSEYVATAGLTLPQFIVSAEIQNEIAALYAAYCMNVDNNAVTQYTNFGFNSFTKIGGSYFAASSSGIYELTGDDDNGTDISTSIGFRTDDFGDGRASRVAAVYVSTEAADDLRVGLEANGVVYQYEVPENGSNSVVSRRVDTCKGEKAVYWKVSMSNMNGADFRLHSVDVLAKKLARRL